MSISQYIFAIGFLLGAVATIYSNRKKDYGLLTGALAITVISLFGLIAGFFLTPKF